MAVLILSFNMVNYTDQFSNKPTLYFWNEIYLVMMYEIFLCFWILFATMFLKIFASILMGNTGLQFCFLVLSLSVWVLGECS